MDFENCIHEKLFDTPDDTETLDLVPIPELHLMLSIVNKLLALLDEKWLKLSGIKNHAYKLCDLNNIHCLSCKLLLEKSFPNLGLMFLAVCIILSSSLWHLIKSAWLASVIS